MKVAGQYRTNIKEKKLFVRVVELYSNLEQRIKKYTMKAKMVIFIQYVANVKFATLVVKNKMPNKNKHKALAALGRVLRPRPCYWR